MTVSEIYSALISVQTRRNGRYKIIKVREMDHLANGICWTWDKGGRINERGLKRLLAIYERATGIKIDPDSVPRKNWAVHRSDHPRCACFECRRR